MEKLKDHILKNTNASTDIDKQNEEFVREINF